MKRLIIDGYNLLNCPDFDVPTHFDLEDQRNYLIRRLESFAALQGSTITVVFDNSQQAPAQLPAGKGIKILFSPPRREADDVIKRMIRKEKNGHTLTIVTSDRAIRFTADSHGVSSLSSPEFSRLLRKSSPPSSTSDPAGPDQDIDISGKYDAEIDEDDVQFWKGLFEKGDDD